MRKIIITLSIILTILGIKNYANAISSCPLQVKTAQKTAFTNSVYYISADCKKRPIRNPAVFFSHFTGWKDVNITTQNKLNAIPNHELSFLPWGPRKVFDNGSLIKTVTDPKVYLKLNDKIYPIESENIFLGMGYQWDWIEDVDPAVINKFTKSTSIASNTDYPTAMMFKYSTSPKVYIIGSINNTLVKQHINTYQQFKDNYRVDRLPVLSSAVTYSDSTSHAVTLDIKNPIIGSSSTPQNNTPANENRTTNNIDTTPSASPGSNTNTDASTTPTATCGNNISETGETCDGGSISCASNGYAGTQSCNSSCSGYNTCVASESCGDGIINGNEVCDGNSLNSKSCQTQGYDSGTLSCASDCGSFATNSCQIAQSSSSLITASVSPSRTSCTAPCSVFFDATETIGLPDNDYVNAEFSWDFKDAQSTHPTADGFVVAHVFETPGTYNVVVSVKDKLGNTASTITPITVNSFSGTTYCVSASGAIDCPGGTVGLQNFSQVYAEIDTDGEGSNKKFMFKRGERFEMNNAVYLRDTNNLEFSAYGTGAAPKLVPIHSNSGVLMPRSNTQDVRFVDLDLDGEGTAAMESIYSRSNNVGEILFLRMEVHGLERGVDFQSAINTPIYIVDSNFHDFFTNHHIYYNSNYLVLIGSSFVNDPTASASTHNFYLSNIYKSYIADNTMGGWQQSDILRLSNDGRDQGLLGGDVVISGNTIYTTNDVIIMLHIGPNSAGGCDASFPPELSYQNCWQSIDNVLVEKNKFYYGGRWGQIQLGGGSKNVTIRNNIFETNRSGGYAIYFYSHNSDGSYGKAGTASENTNIYHNTFLSRNWGPAIQVSNWATQSELDNAGTRNGVNGPPFYHSNIDIQNNIFYSEDPGALAVDHESRNGATILAEISMNNNLYYFPNNTSWETQATNKDSNQVLGDPLFVNQNGASVSVLEDDDLKISSGSPAIDAANNLQIGKDFSDNSRPQGAGYDIGAYEY